MQVYPQAANRMPMCYVGRFLPAAGRSGMTVNGFGRAVDFYGVRTAVPVILCIFAPIPTPIPLRGRGWD